MTTANPMILLPRRRSSTMLWECLSPFTIIPFPYMRSGRSKAQKLYCDLQHPQHQTDQRHIAGLFFRIRFLHDIVFAIKLIQAVGQLIDIVAQAVWRILSIGLINRLIEATQGQGQVRLFWLSGGRIRPSWASG